MTSGMSASRLNDSVKPVSFCSFRQGKLAFSAELSIVTPNSDPRHEMGAIRRSSETMEGWIEGSQRKQIGESQNFKSSTQSTRISTSQSHSSKTTCQDTEKDSTKFHGDSRGACIHYWKRSHRAGISFHGWSVAISNNYLRSGPRGCRKWDPLQRKHKK